MSARRVQLTRLPRPHSNGEVEPADWEPRPPARRGPNWELAAVLVAGLIVATLAVLGVVKLVELVG